MKGMKKAAIAAAAFIASFMALSVDGYAATGIYVGKDVSAEGTTLIGASVEGETGITCMPEIIERGSLAKGDVIESENGFKYALPDDNAAMVVETTMSYVFGSGWDSAATNEYGVSVVAAITTATNPDAVAADPFVEKGISEEKLARIVTATSKSAFDGVKLLTSMYRDIGAYAPEIVLIADRNGAWAVENFTGHEFVAVKLPDDKIATFSNEPIIRTADPDDPDTICSEKLFAIPEEKGFAVYDKDKNLDLIRSYIDPTSSDESHIRGWIGHDVFAPSEELKYDAKGGYDVFFIPDEDVSIKDAFEFFRNRYEGTRFDLSDADNEYWGINNQAVGAAQIIQVFPDAPEALSAVLWATPSNPTASPFLPIPAFTSSIPEGYTTDVADASFENGIIQFDFAKLNNSVVPKRDLYGKSVRQFWHGTECVLADDVAQCVAGNWADAYESSAEKASCIIDEYVKKSIEDADEDCIRISDELDWYLFRNGIKKPSIPDEEIVPFECSFDAVTYANANGWQTKIEGDTFTAIKDGRTIEVVFEGDNKGNVTFKGFDDEQLKEDFGEEALTEVDENGNEDDADAVKDAEAEDAEEPEETSDEPVEAPEEPEEPEETVSTQTVENGESGEQTEVITAKADIKTAEDIETAAADVIEVDTIDALEKYFAEKIASVPRDGWSEREIATQLSDISGDVSGIIRKYFNIRIDKFDDILNLDKSLDIDGFVASPERAKVEKKLSETGDEISSLVSKYFMSTYEDVSRDLDSGRLSQEGAVKILTEARNDVEAVVSLYVNGVFGQVFNTDLSAQEVADIFKELGAGTLQMMQDYGAIDPKDLKIGDVGIDELTDADISVVVTLNEMDDDVINGLSDILGVDVRSRLDELLKDINRSTPENFTIKEEDHETERADAQLEPKVEAVQELQQALSEDDIEVPQEVIDILNEAIREAGEARGENPPDTVTDTAPDTSSGSAYTVNVGNVEEDGGKIMLPAFMLTYFN